MKRTLLLFSVIILEGYVVLATELLAIRETIPYVGSGTDTVSIIIAAVLMPLAFGYYRGGAFRPSAKHGVRRKLVFNILVSLAVLIPGLSYVCMNFFFYGLIRAGLTHRLALQALYALCFLVTPVYLLGQTIPLVSNYFPRQKLARITGRILFFSTLGSFTGAVLSTLVLMSTVGVHHTAAVNFVLLAGLVLLLGRKKISEQAGIAVALALAGLLLNADANLAALHVVGNNKYNTVKVFTDPATGDRHMSLNHMGSSMYNDNGCKHPYVEFLERQLVDPIRKSSPPKDLLVIGAGAFTFGLEDKVNRYEYVDIDASLRDTAEKYVLRRKLSPNKTFIPMEARAFLIASDRKYDVIVLDAYLGGVTMPEHLVTREFYRQVRAHLKENGIVAANFILAPDFSSPISRHMDDTFRSVFPYFSRHVIDDKYGLWDGGRAEKANILYLYRAQPDETPDLYTDDRNRMFLDKPQKY